MKTTFKLMPLLLAVPLVLTACTGGGDNPTPVEPKPAGIDQNIGVESTPVFKKFANIPEGWSETVKGANESLTNKDGSCRIMASVQSQPFTGMGLGDTAVSNNTFVLNYGYQADPATAVLGETEIKNVFGSPAEFMTYEFNAERDFIDMDSIEKNEDKPQFDTKKTRSFVAIRGFEQPVDENGKQVSPVMIIDGYCTDVENFDRDMMKQIVDSAEIGYNEEENGSNED